MTNKDDEERDRNGGHLPWVDNSEINTRHVTDKGTEYTVEKWTCDLCKKPKSTLYIDDEWCHGDGHACSSKDGRFISGCTDCVLNT